METKALIFDLDGVIVSTDRCHYLAWKQLVVEEGIPYDEAILERVRGVGRMECLTMLIERASRSYTQAEKVEMADRKNNYYREMIKILSPADILPGVTAFLAEARSRGLLLAIASSSRNSPMILERIGLDKYFDATADGNDITRSKPDPEVFLLAAERIGIEPKYCIVVEDAEAGIAGAIAGGMRTLAVGFAATDPRATVAAPDLAAITVEQVLRSANSIS